MWDERDLQELQVASERENGGVERSAPAHTLRNCKSAGGGVPSLAGAGRQDRTQQEGPGEPHDTWLALLKLLFLIVINNNICLH